VLYLQQESMLPVREESASPVRGESASHVHEDGDFPPKRSLAASLGIGLFALAVVAALTSAFVFQKTWIRALEARLTRCALRSAEPCHIGGTPGR